MDFYERKALESVNISLIFYFCLLYTSEKILSILKKEVKEMEGIKYVVISKSHNVYDDRGERWQLEVFNSDINEMSKIFSVKPLYYTTMYTTIS